MRLARPRLAALVVVFLAVSCSGEDVPSIGPAATTEPTSNATADAASRPEPTPTEAPPTAEPTPAAGDDGRLTLQSTRDSKEPTTIDVGGVRITVRRAAVADYAEFYEASGSEARRALDVFESETGGAVTIGQLELVVENTTQQRINVYPDQGLAVVGSEQVDIALFLSDDVGGEYFPGVIKEGRVFFFLTRISVTETESILYVVNGPSGEDFRRLGDDYQFTIAVSPAQ